MDGVGGSGRSSAKLLRLCWWPAKVCQPFKVLRPFSVRLRQSPESRSQSMKHDWHSPQVSKNGARSEGPASQADQAGIQRAIPDVVC